MGIRIETQTPDHAGGLFAALSDPRVYTHLDEDPPSSVSELRARLERLTAGGPPDGDAGGRGGGSGEGPSDDREAALLAFAY